MHKDSFNPTQVAAESEAAGILSRWIDELHHTEVHKILDSNADPNTIKKSFKSCEHLNDMAKKVDKDEDDSFDDDN